MQIRLRQIVIGSFCVYRGPEDKRYRWASDPNITISELKILLTDPDAMVRIRLAHRSNLSKDMIGTLLNDKKSTSVRFAILCNEYIKIPEEELLKIANDEKEEYFIRFRANRLLPDKLKVKELEEGCFSFYFFIQKIRTSSAD